MSSDMATTPRNNTPWNAFKAEAKARPRRLSYAIVPKSNNLHAWYLYKSPVPLRLFF